MVNMTRLLERAGNYYRTRSSFYRERDMRTFETFLPCISFTFDDFPQTAAINGGAILNHHGLRGSFYASMGMMGKDSPVGPLFTVNELEELIRYNHEIGCHTYDHLDAWKANPDAFRMSIERNAADLRRFFPGMHFKTTSYVVNEPHPRIKRMAGKHFDCCRGGGQTLNERAFDRQHLKSCFVNYRNRDNIRALKELIDRNARLQGWLIFSTHDVTAHPSPFGCIPETFECLVKYAIGSGAVVKPVHDVYTSFHVAP